MFPLQPRLRIRHPLIKQNKIVVLATQRDFLYFFFYLLSFFLLSFLFFSFFTPFSLYSLNCIYFRTFAARLFFFFFFFVLAVKNLGIRGSDRTRDSQSVVSRRRHLLCYDPPEILMDYRSSIIIDRPCTRIILIHFDNPFVERSRCIAFEQRYHRGILLSTPKMKSFRSKESSMSKRQKKNSF